jgi:hypothetical protein
VNEHVVAVIGGGSGSRIEVLRETSPGSLSVVADLGGLSRNVGSHFRGPATAVAGRNVYVVYEGAAIQEIDVSDPAHPASVGWLRTPFNSVCDAQGAGSFLYLSGCDGIMVAQTSPVP